MLAAVPVWTPVDFLPGFWFALAAVFSVAVLRRWYDRPSWRFLLLSSVVIVGLFADVLVGGKVLLPLDNLRGHAPFRQLRPTDPHGNILQGDPLQLVAPALVEVREAYEKGRWPLWRDREGAGMPLGADPQAQAFQPLALYSLAVSATSAPAVLAALRVWMALLFVFLWLRRLGARESAAAAGAVTFGLGGFLQQWLTWPLANTAAWLPVALYALARLDRSGVDPSRTDRSETKRPWRFARRRDLGLLTVALVGLLLSGHPETIALSLGVLAIDVCARCFARRESGRFRPALAAGAIVLVAVAITAPVLVPTATYLPQTLRWERGLEDRPSGPAEDPGVAIAEHVAPATRLVQLAAPNSFGNDRFVHYWGRDNINEDASGFAGTIPLLLVLALALSRFRRTWRPIVRHEGLALIGAGVLMLLLALPTGVTGRLALAGNLVFALVAAAGVERFAQGRMKRWTIALAALALLGVHLFAYRTFTAPGAPETLDVLRWGWVLWHSRFLVASGLILIGGLTGILVGEGSGLGRWLKRLRAVFPLQAVGAWALALLIAAELTIAYRDVNPPMPKRLLFPQTPELAAMVESQETSPGERFVGIGRAMPPNLAAIYGLNDIRIFNPMAPADYLATLAPTLDGWNGEAPSVGNADHPLFDLLGVNWILTTAETGCPAALGPLDLSGVDTPADALLCQRPEALERLFLPTGIRATVNPRADVWEPFDPRSETLVETRGGSQSRDAILWRTDGPARLTIDWSKATPERLDATLEAAEPRWLASSIVQDGGWRVLVEGERVPTTRTNVTFVGAWLSEGSEVRERRLTLLYRPQGWLIGWWVAALGLAAVLARLARPRRASRIRV